MSRKNTNENFWEKVNKTSGCWVWKSRLSSSGYGEFYYHGKNIKAHRFSWVIAHGEIPDGLLVCHHCDNPPCVRPNHLFLGTSLDNLRDCQAKGRRRALTGSDNPRSKLNEQTARLIFAVCPKYIRVVDASKIFGVDRATIGDVVHGRTWVHCHGTGKVPAKAGG